jgi:hypothetical protein
MSIGADASPALLNAALPHTRASHHDDALLSCSPIQILHLPPHVSISKLTFHRMLLLIASLASLTSSQRRRRAIFHSFATMSLSTRAESTRKLAGMALFLIICF